MGLATHRNTRPRNPLSAIKQLISLLLEDIGAVLRRTSVDRSQQSAAGLDWRRHGKWEAAMQDPELAVLINRL